MRLPTKPGPKSGVQATAAPSAPAAQPAPARRVLASACWLAFFANTDRADLYADALDHPEHLVVPAHTGDEVASTALSLRQQGAVVPMALRLALDAAGSADKP